MEIQKTELNPDFTSLIDSLYTRKGIIDFLLARGLNPSRAMGQNFLINRTMMRKILDRLDLPEDGCVMEIGPGLGHLTWLLMERGLNVTAVEKDRFFISTLNELAPAFRSELNLIHDDVMECDIGSIAQERSIRHFIGNLPYNISVPILFKLAYCPHRFERINVMLQKEVGDRILAVPGTKSYGRLSIVLKYIYDVQKIQIISPEAFFPRPRVESVFLSFIPKSSVDIEFAQLFLERIVKIGFLHRRKKLRKQFLGAIIEKRILDQTFLEQVESFFDFEKRAEEWPIDKWVDFALYIRECEPKRI